jgi:hypothetical protein
MIRRKVLTFRFLADDRDYSEAELAETAKEILETMKNRFSHEKTEIVSQNVYSINYADNIHENL